MSRSGVILGLYIVYREAGAMRRRLLGSLVACAVVGALAATIGGAVQGASGAPPQITTNLAGPDLFALACASCHGPAGYGRVFTRGGQTVKVPSLRYSRLAKVYGKNFDALVRRAIVQGLDEEGKPLNPMMPRWTNLSSADVAKLIAYLKTFR
jgi:mono/diheme cytochrome c family protein